MGGRVEGGMGQGWWGWLTGGGGGSGVVVGQGWWGRGVRGGGGGSGVVGVGQAWGVGSGVGRRVRGGFGCRFGEWVRGVG